MNFIALDVMTSLSNSIAAVFRWLDQNFSTIFQAILIFIGALIAAQVLCHIFSRVLSKTMRPEMFPTKADRDKRLKTLNSISNAIIKFSIWSIAFIMILTTLGINTAPLLASAGILSVAIGFGAQSLVKDFVTGMFIIAENQYRVGDYVEIQNVRGTVQSVTMRTTVVKDDDGSIFYIPNGSIIVSGNHTMNNNKVSIEVSASTETNFDQLRDIINNTGKKQAASQSMQDNVVEPLQFKRIKDIKGGLVIIRISGRVKAGKQIDVKSDYYMLLQEELSKNKIALK